MRGLPEVGTNWFDHDRGRVWRIHMIAAGNTSAAPEIALVYANGEEMSFELLSPEEWAARVAAGRYKLIEA